MLANFLYQRTLQYLPRCCALKRIKCCSAYIPRVSLFTKNTSRVHFLRRELVFSTPKNNISSSLPKKNVDYYKQDKIPKDYQIVYQAPMRYYILSSQIGIIVISFGLVIALGSTLYDIFLKTEEYEYSVFAETSVQLQIAKFALLMFFIGLNIIVKRFVLRIYFNENNNKFILMTPGIIPNVDRQMIIRAGEMKSLGDQNLNGLLGQYAVNNDRFIILEDYFQVPYYLSKMLGQTKEK